MIDSVLNGLFAALEWIFNVLRHSLDRSFIICNLNDRSSWLGVFNSSKRSPCRLGRRVRGLLFSKKKIIKKTQKNRTIYSFMLCSRVRSKIINFSVLNSTRKLEFSNLGCLNFADGAVKIIWTNLIRKQ